MSSFSETLCDSKRNMIEDQDLPRSRADTGSKRPRSNRSSTYTIQTTEDTTLRRTSDSFMRLSITDLLQRVEDQSKVSAMLFPLVDKEKLERKEESSDDSLEDITAYIDSCGDITQKSRHFDLLEDIELSSQQSSQTSFEADPRIRKTSQTIKTESTSSEKCSRRVSLPVVIVKKSSLPPEELPFGMEVGAKASMGCSILFGVHIEYMVLSNQLKVNVKRFGNLPSEYGKRKFECFTAKLCLLPGGTHKQKVRVTNGIETTLDRPSAYFREISDLSKREIGVAIYVKHGFFRRLGLIYEWTISMEKVDLIEPQTAWKRIDCQV